MIAAYSRGSFAELEAMRLVAELPEFEEFGAEALPGVVKAVSAYVRHYSSDGTNLRVIAIEEPVETEFFGHRYTARVDLVLEDNGGKVWYLDHKFVAKVEGKVFRRYVLSGQFLGLQHLGMRTYGERFGGVKVNVIGCNVSGFSRVSLDPAIGREAHGGRRRADVEAVDHVVKNQEAKLLVEARGHCQEHGNRERVQM